MKIIKKDNFVFYADVEKTKEYYSSLSDCGCYGCRNLCAQIKDFSPELNDFLSEFGIDICRPDESVDFPEKDHVYYSLVGYTVTGHIETNGIYKTKIGTLRIEITNGNSPDYWFPNEQKEPHFFISVSGITLPWVLDEPIPDEERFIDKVIRFIKDIFKPKNKEQ